MLLSHHPAEQQERCAHVGRHRVCRRCLTLYPVTLAVIAAALTGALPPPGGGSWLWWLTLPATAEYCGEALGVLSYRRRRQVLLTAALALGLGWGLVAEVRTPGAVAYWGVVATQGAVTAGATVRGWHLRQRRHAMANFNASVQGGEERLGVSSDRDSGA